jgi:hypothetical protein
MMAIRRPPAVLLGPDSRHRPQNLLFDGRADAQPGISENSPANAAVSASSDLTFWRARDVAAGKTFESCVLSGAGIGPKKLGMKIIVLLGADAMGDAVDSDI